MSDPKSGLKRSLLMAPLLLGLSSGPLLAQGAPPSAAEQRAVAAAARGDLRAALIDLRNVVRQNPDAVSARVALARVSLELGDGETAEREARAALQRGFDRVAGTALLLRAFQVGGRNDALLQAFPEPAREHASPVDRAVAAQVAAARATALLSVNEPARAAQAVELARHLAPNAAETGLAAFSIAFARGDRAAAEAELDRVLAREPNQAEALIRKSTLLFERGERAEAIARLDTVLAATPANVPALLRRAEALLATDQVERAQRDLDLATNITPNNAAAHYLRATVAARTQDWAGVDRSLQRLGPAVASFPEGFLMLALAKRGLGQREQAEDAARRHLARNPDDPRGARLLAGMALEGNRPDDAMATLADMARRGNADAGALEMLARLYTANGRRQEALAALEEAVRRAPQEAGLLAQLAGARLAVGNVPGAIEAAQAARRIDPNLAGMQEVMAFAALYRGDVQEVTTLLDRLPPATQQGEGVAVLRASAALMRLDVPRARAAFEDVLRRNPNSITARIGLSHLARLQGNPAEMERLMGEVLRLDPGNLEALSYLTTAAAPGEPRAAQARAVLEAVNAAEPTRFSLAMALAGVLTRAGEGARALAVLQPVPVSPETSVALQLARAEAHGASSEWGPAQQAARAALTEAPASSMARRLLAVLMVQAGDPRGAEVLLEQGLRSQPGDAILQQALVMLVRENRGLDAALALADRMAADPRAMPAAASLRGDLLLAAQRPAEAATAHAAVQAANPTAQGARRVAGALRAAGRHDEARAVLAAWLERMPEDDGTALLLAQIDIEQRRFPAATERLERVVERRPENAVALNNLAWLLGEHGGEGVAARARRLAERAYFIAPLPEIADTLGWILARGGEAALAVPLLRQSVEARAPGAADPGAVYRLASALNATGARDEALRVLAPVMEGTPAQFAERDAATRLLGELRGRR